MIDLATLDFEKNHGLVTIVAQDATTGAVLMVAHADREALERTLATGEMHYRSRTRGLWHKGATSGNVQRVVGLVADCDGDAVLARVERVGAGPACHTGSVSCFGEGALSVDVMGAVDETVRGRAAELGSVDPSSGASGHSSYTQRLLGDRNLRLKKLGEEAAELVLACADGDRARAAEEAADLLYHTIVALRAIDVGLDDVRGVLAARAGRGRPGS